MLDDKKTIFALATVPGKSGVAVIRISGPNAFDCILPISKKPLPLVRQATLRHLFNPITNSIIDQAIIIIFEAPDSFTGENIVELQIHGSKAIINILLKILASIENYRLANPGEFARRAFLNGKMDLTAAEGLADLIEAETLVQQQQAMRLVEGELGNLYQTWKNEVISCLALIEAYIDFPDEDIPEDTATIVEKKIQELITSLKKHLENNRRGEVIRNGIQVAILGVPNVGKSSLLNYLAKRDVAIVSDIAGTTRDIIEINLDLNGYPVTIADTAGIRESEDFVEKEGVSRALRYAKNTDIKIVMFSEDSPLSEEMKELIDKDTILLKNKVDTTSITKNDFLEISVKNDLGLDVFLEKLSELIELKFSPSSEPVLTRERHRQFLNIALEHLLRFDLNNPLELASEDLRLAARALGQVVGVIDVEMILDEVFRNFCIGK